MSTDLNITTRLETAHARITAIFEEYDVTGGFTLQYKSDVKYGFTIDATWNNIAQPMSPSSPLTFVFPPQSTPTPRGDQVDGSAMTAISLRNFGQMSSRLSLQIFDILTQHGYNLPRMVAENHSPDGSMADGPTQPIPPTTGPDRRDDDPWRRFGRNESPRTRRT